MALTAVSGPAVAVPMAPAGPAADRELRTLRMETAQLHSELEILREVSVSRTAQHFARVHAEKRGHMLRSAAARVAHRVAFV